MEKYDVLFIFTLFLIITSSIIDLYFHFRMPELFFYLVCSICLCYAYMMMKSI